MLMFTILSWGLGSFFYKLANNQMHPVVVSSFATIVYLILTPFNYWLFKPNTSISLGGVFWSLAGATFMSVGSLSYFFTLKSGNNGGQITATTSVYPIATIILSCCFLG